MASEDKAGAGWKTRRLRGYACVCVCVLGWWWWGGGGRGGFVVHEPAHSWPAPAWFWSVARGHGGHRSQLSACDGLIQTPPPPTLTTTTTPPPPQQPAHAWWACLRGDVLRRVGVGGIGGAALVSILTLACI